MFDSLQLEANFSITTDNGFLQWQTSPSGVQEFSFSDRATFLAFLRSLKGSGLTLSRMRKGYTWIRKVPLQVTVDGKVWYAKRPGKGRTIYYRALLSTLFRAFLLP